MVASNDQFNNLYRMLPKLYSTVEDFESSDSRTVSNYCKTGIASELQQGDDDDPPRECRQEVISSGAGSSSLPHLFLHFDINDTILVGDVAGNDTVEESLNKIIAKAAFVSTRKTTTAEITTTAAAAAAATSTIHNRDEQINNDLDKSENDGSKVESSSRDGNYFANFEPRRWWDGSDLHCCYHPSTSTTITPTTFITSNKTNKDNRHCNLLDNSTSNPPPSSPPPAPLYTGWTIPDNTCSYYKTAYKRHAKDFTLYHSQYRPMYELLQSKLLVLDCAREEKRGAGTVGADTDDEMMMFRHFLPAFFHTLTYYFPSTATSTDSTDTIINNNNNATRLPRPPKTTLVLRTFGADLHRVLRAISEFAKGKHPHFPEYTNPSLIFKEDDGLFCGGWRSRRSKRRNGNGVVGPVDNEDGDGDSEELVYELHPMISSCFQQKCYSGDDEILTYLQSKTIVGIQDNYDFWDDHGCAPWAGKPVWASRRPGMMKNDDRLPQYNNHHHHHHHLLLDDNIHNDPNDGAGAVRIPVRDSVENASTTTAATTTTPCTTTTKYTSLHGNEALKMHGTHLIRVPTVRPILELGWFIQQIEDARWRIFVEEAGVSDDDDRCCKENTSKKDKESRTDNITAKKSLDLSRRDLSDDDLYQILIQQPPYQGIEKMNLSRNRLKCLPGVVFSCTMVVHLDFSRNSLRGLPAEIRNLSNLVELIALSNQLRMRQLPVEAIVSLRHLKLLDLRYNPKLKRGALEILREALAPNNNSHLEIRCTTVDAEVDKASALAENCSTMRSIKSEGTKKLSACDRDATLLRSQLEPLSTPQLSKRLEQTFGVSLSEGVAEQDRYDREFVMKKLLGCYEQHGPRRVIKVDGHIMPSSYRLASILAELEAIPWPHTTRERPKIQAEYYMILQKPGSGKSDSARTRNETAKLNRYRQLFEMAVDTLAEHDPDFVKRFTALAVTRNFVGSPHIDTLNVGPFYGLSLGDFTGGGRIAVEYSPLIVAEVNTHGRFGKVDGRYPHWVTPYEGTRYSLIYYVTSGSVEPQTAAVFPPLPDNAICGDPSRSISQLVSSNPSGNGHK